MGALVSILVLGTFVAFFGLAIVVVSSFLGPKVRSTRAKHESYECGLKVQNPEHTKIPIKFYLTAILFILFDIEIIFMYPWALAYGDFLGAGNGLYILVAMGIFLAIFILGLFWEVKSKALEWD